MYYIFEGIPVKGKDDSQFLLDNDHLIGHEVSKQEYDAAAEIEKRKRAREKRAERYPAIIEQLEVILDQFAAFEQQGQSLTQAMQDLLATCQSVRDEDS